MRPGTGFLLATVLWAAAPRTADALPGDAEPTLETIGQLRDAGNVEAAAKQAGDLVSKHPQDLDANLTYQDLELALGRDKQVLDLYRNAAKAPDATADQHYLFARLLRGVSAIAEFRAALKADPRHFWALCGLGVELTHAKSWNEAKDVLDQARTLRADSAVPLNALGRVEEGRGKSADAEKLYRAAIDLAPDMVVARVNLGVLLVGVGRKEEAVKTLEDAATRAPKDPMPLLGLGMFYMAEKTPDRAASYYRKAVDLDGGNVTSLNLLANAYIDLDQDQLAEQTLQKALAKAPDSLVTQIDLAYVRVQNEQFDEAAKFASRAVQIDETSAEAHYVLGLVLDHQQNPKKAEAEFHKAERLEPDDPVYARALGALAASQGDWHTAIAEGQRVVKLTNGSSDAQLELARTYVRADKAKSAETTYEELLAADPARLDAWLELGVVRRRDLHDFKKAAKAFHEYVNRGGTDPRVPQWIAALEEK